MTHLTIRKRLHCALCDTRLDTWQCNTVKAIHWSPVISVLPSDNRSQDESAVCVREREGEMYAATWGDSEQSIDEYRRSIYQVVRMSRVTVIIHFMRVRSSFILCNYQVTLFFSLSRTALAAHFTSHSRSFTLSLSPSLPHLTTTRAYISIWKAQEKQLPTTSRRARFHWWIERRVKNSVPRTARQVKKCVHRSPPLSRLLHRLLREQHSNMKEIAVHSLHTVRGEW